MAFLFAQFVLIAWLPVATILFASSASARKAMIFSFVFAWLALPNISFPLPGLPDYGKMMATVVAVLLCTFLFNQARMFSVRPRWYDLPVVAWCFGPFLTALSNDLGPYEACAACVAEAVNWGLPYFIGRVYLTDAESIRDLAVAILVGGICYIPLCLYEIRFSPMLQAYVYGVIRWEGERYGGYRPKVFLATGLELGIYMTNATLIGWMLWASGTIKSIRGVSMGKLMLALAGTTLLCKSTGALMLLAFGVALMWCVKRTGWAFLLWLTIAIPPCYSYARGTGAWSAMELVEYSKASFGEDRAQSIEYRFIMENKLAERAAERPILGWGRFDRFQPKNAKGNAITVPDGFWIIAQGTQGLVGLSSVLTMFLLPLALTIRRFPISTWSDPLVCPIVTLSFVLVLTMIDFLSNAMLNPLYPLAIGGLLCQKSFRPEGDLDEVGGLLEVASGLAGEGHLVEAESEFRRAAELASGRDDIEGLSALAKALDGLGHSLYAAGRVSEAEDALREAVTVRDRLAAEVPDPGRFRDLAISREGLARVLAEAGRVAEAIDERRVALRIRDGLDSQQPRDAESRSGRANALNDLAWLLATDSSRRDPAYALSLAEEAVRISADHDAFWNTLGVARYRADDWTGAIEALERSALSTPGGVGTAFDHYILSMAWCRLGRADQAREWLERGDAWMTRHRPDHATLIRFREAAEVLLRGEDGTGDTP